MALGLFWSLFCLCGFFLILRIDKMGFFRKENKFPVEGRTVLITGGSQGMGRSVARLLAERGANVVIVARTVKKLEESIAYVAAGAKNKDSQRFTHFSADLSDPSESSRIIEATTVWNNGSPPDIVWCIAGSSSAGLFLDKPVELLQQQMGQNYLASACMAHAALKAWLKPISPETNKNTHTSQEPRHLVFTSSFLALFAFTGYGAYSPAKAALRSLADTLSMELLLYPPPTYIPVKTHTIFPATILSEGLEVENRIKHPVTKKLEEDDEGQTPDEVAKCSLRGLEQGKEMIATTWQTRLVMSGTLGGSRRAGFAVLDTLLAWVMSVVMIFVRADLDGKTKAWGLKYGPGHPEK